MRHWLCAAALLQLRSPLLLPLRHLLLVAGQATPDPGHLVLTLLQQLLTWLALLWQQQVRTASCWMRCWRCWAETGTPPLHLLAACCWPALLLPGLPAAHHVLWQVLQQS
jgi:hypothetical protein